MSKSFFIKKETLTQVFSCEFCETFKNIFVYRTPSVTCTSKIVNNDIKKRKDRIMLPLYQNYKGAS